MYSEYNIAEVQMSTSEIWLPNIGVPTGYLLAD